MGDVNRRVDIGGGVGGDHAPEQCRGQTAGQRRNVAERLDIVPKSFGPFVQRGFCRFRIVDLGGKARGFSGQPGDFRFSQQQCLTASFALIRLVAINGLLEDRFQGFDDIFRIVFLERPDHPLRHQFARPVGSFGAINIVQSVRVMLGGTPMALKTLRGNTGSLAAAVRQAFGQARIVTVQQCGGVGMQAVDL